MPVAARPTTAGIDRIAAMTDPVARNHAITACYHALSLALADALGPSANWCTFAAWASRQAGTTIRGEDLDEALAGRLRGSTLLLEVARERAPHVLQCIRDQAPLRRASAAVARGNLKVFAEIGRVFAQFLSSPIDQVVASLRPGDPPDGQQLLREAFETFAGITAHSTPSERAQRLLYANLLVGLHEQTRLQPEIQEALDVLRHDLEALRPLLLTRLLPSWWQRTRRAWSSWLGRPLPLDAALDGLVQHICREGRELMTAELMTLQLPSGTVRLGHDLPAEAPPTLQHLSHPPLHARMARLEAGAARAAGQDRDWADFDYRMCFIARLFRAYQEDPALLRAPVR